MRKLCFLFFIFASIVCEGAEAKLKVLHLTFHKGCEREIQEMAQELNLDISTWFIPSLPAYSFDPESHGNVLYNISHDRANRIWEKHKDFFQSFDLILTSDTAPLSRIFLQNQWKKPLIIWICNRFDYHDNSTSEGDFPDEEYYQLFNSARNAPNVKIVAYTDYEHYYAHSKGIDTGSLTIKPASLPHAEDVLSPIPESVDKPNSFFLPPYHNETKFMNLSQFLADRGIQNYSGPYNGSADLKEFKGIIHLPYAWSNLALFENVSTGVQYFIPSVSFLEELASQEGYFHQSMYNLVNEKLYPLSEWYNEENRDYFIYFDSWDDLQMKIEQTDLIAHKSFNREKATNHRKQTIQTWKNLLDPFRPAVPKKVRHGRGRR